jgi:hypothetical protein
VDYADVTDVQWPLAAHLLHGLPFVEGTITKSNGIVQQAGSFFDLRTAAAKSAKASTIRAISGLVREGWLILAPSVARREGAFRWGYVLAPRGLDLGHTYERPFAPALIWRAGLIIFPGAGGVFPRVYAHLCSGAITLDHLLATFRALTPCPVASARPGAPEHRQYADWERLHRQERWAALTALLGEGDRGDDTASNALGYTDTREGHTDGHRRL